MISRARVRAGARKRTSIRIDSDLVMEGIETALRQRGYPSILPKVRQEALNSAAGAMDFHPLVECRLA
jgi:hypothetical protein